MALFHYAITTLWPGFHPGASRVDAPRWTASWESLWFDGPALFHASIWHAAVNLSVRRRCPITEHASLIHYHRAVRYLSAAVHVSVDDVEESTMFAILALATAEEGSDNDCRQPNMGFEPPFADLQWLNVLSRRPMVSSHRDALFRLVELKGGLDAITMRGFSGAVFLLDIISATSVPSPPRFKIPEALKLTGPFGNQSSHSKTRGVISSPIDRLRLPGLEKEIHEVLIDMRAWTTFIERFSEGQVPLPDLALISAERSILQHRLLCTVPIAKGEGTDLSSRRGTQNAGASDVNDLVQSGMLIFSAGVVFPIADMRVHHRLAERLKVQLLRYQHGMQDSSLQDVLTWLYMLGCLAGVQASDLSLREWFVDGLYQVEKRRATRRKEGNRTHDVGGSDMWTEELPFMVRSWPDVRDLCLERILWHSRACDPMAEVAWKQVQWKAKHCT